MAIPEERLRKALYVFNFVNCSFIDNNPPLARRFTANTSFEARVKAPVLVRDPETETVKLWDRILLLHGEKVKFASLQKKDLDGSQRRMQDLSVNLYCRQPIATPTLQNEIKTA